MSSECFGISFLVMRLIVAIAGGGVIRSITFAYLVFDYARKEFAHLRPVAWQCPRVRRLGETNHTLVLVCDANVRLLFLSVLSVGVGDRLAIGEMTSSRTRQSVGL